MLRATTLAVDFICRAKPEGGHPAFIRITLIFCTWIYFGLNFSFFGFPLLWANPSPLLFVISVIGLTLTALFFDPAERRWYYKAWRKGWS